MKRIAFLITAVAAIGLSAPAFAAQANDPAPKASKEFKLPSQGEIDEMIENMPDFNGIMDDMIDVMTDEKMQDRLESTAEKFKDLVDEDLLKERRENGLPDINNIMAVMLGAMSEDGAAGELLEGMSEVATELETIVEKHVPETSPQR